MPPTKRPTPESASIAAIAKQHLGIATLETRFSDDLDFSEQAVWAIEAALAAAYQAGANASTSS